MYIKSTYDGLHVITGTTENVSFQCIPFNAAQQSPEPVHSLDKSNYGSPL